MKVYKQWWFWLILIVLIALMVLSFLSEVSCLERVDETNCYEKNIFGVILFENHTYSKFSLDFETSCKTYYEECVCVGKLAIAESYPPQYFCEVEETCNKIEPPKIEC